MENICDFLNIESDRSGYSGKSLKSSPHESSPRRRKVVLKLDVEDGKRKKEAMKAVSTVAGVETIAMDMRDKKMTVIGDCDPVQIVRKLRRKFAAEILTVGPAGMEKKELPTKKEGELNKTGEKKIVSESVDAFSSRLESHNCPKVLTEVPKEEEWNAEEIRAIVDELSVLPESPNCSFLLQLSFEGSFALTTFPSSFFEQMPLLQHLNLSRTSIKSLPASLLKLTALKTLILRNCELFMELSPQIGELHNLEVLDLDETQILFLPNEVRNLSKLKFLRVSFYGYMNCGKRLQQNPLIHLGTISALSQLTTISIDVNPDDERWNAVVEAVVEEACRLRWLECLILYLPNVESLGKLRIGNTSLGYYPLLRFRFIVGQHRQCSISRVPEEANAQFQNWDKCLKFVKGKDIPSEMKRVLKCTEAFYLDHHAAATSVCDFGIENMQKLKFCLLVECNEIQTIISGVESTKERTDMLKYGPNNSESAGGSTTLWSETQSLTSDTKFVEENEDMLEDEPNNSESGGWIKEGLVKLILTYLGLVWDRIWGYQARNQATYRSMNQKIKNNSESGGSSDFAQQGALLNLHYLHIYYLKNLVSIWRTPTYDKQCLSCLKFLKLHMCPKLSVIFCPALLANLGMLEVLIVKDCPEVTSVVSLMTTEVVDPQVFYLPRLKRISLLYLPKLVSVSSGVPIAPKLEKIGFYSCPKLQSLSTREMLSGELEVIRGESKWWEALKWNKTEWGNQLDYLQSIFCPITREKDVMTQMEESGRVLDNIVSLGTNTPDAKTSHCAYYSYSN